MNGILYSIALLILCSFAIFLAKLVSNRRTIRGQKKEFMEQRKANCEGCRYFCDDGFICYCKRSTSEMMHCLRPSYSLREEVGSVHKETT